MPSVIHQKPVCQRDIYQKSPNIFGSSNEKTGASPEHQTPKNTPVLSLLSLPSAAEPSLCRYSRKLYRPAKGSTGCGSQQIFRALGGTHISLATAPTTPPCFGHWLRSSLLPFGKDSLRPEGDVASATEGGWLASECETERATIRGRSPRPCPRSAALPAACRCRSWAGRRRRCRPAA